MKLLKTTGALAALVLALSVSVAQAGSFTQLVAFGDSLSDTGNVFTGSSGALPLPPYADGRFSNGAIWIDRLADNLSLSSLNYLNGGTNYAFGGATSGPFNPGVNSPPSMLDQVAIYLSQVGAGNANPNALYSIWIGGNDVLGANPADDPDSEYEIADLAAANVYGAIETLAANGAATFLVPNLPDIGLTPSSSGNQALADYRSGLTAAYNSALAMILGAAEANLGVNIIAFDVATLFAQMVTDPTSFAFTNATDKCWTGDQFGLNGTQCAEPDSYVFWDDVHPTSAAHMVLGDLATDLVDSSVIPVPAALPLLLSGLGFLGVYGRRRAV